SRPGRRASPTRPAWWRSRCSRPARHSSSISGSDVRRVGTIVGVCVVMLIGAACVAAALLGSRAASLGDAAFVERVLIRAARSIPHPGAARVIWLGDSTLMTRAGVSYADRVAAHALAARGVQSNVLALFGLGPLQFYCLMGAVLEARPSVV